MLISKEADSASLYLDADTQLPKSLNNNMMVQLYNEEVNDLLAPENSKLQIHESREAGVYVAGLREDIVTASEQVLELLEEGERSRHTGETRMNKSSSRSHSVFRMVCCFEVSS